MSSGTRIGRGLLAVSLTVALLTALFPARPAAAAGWSMCATPASTDCIVSFTVGGAAPPAGLVVDVVASASQWSIQLKQPTNFANPIDISALVPAATVVNLTLRLGGTASPVVMMGTGVITTFGWNAVTRELSVVASTNASSWSMLGCDISSCASVASHDMSSILLLDADAMDLSGAPPGVLAFATLFRSKVQGGYMATNAQAFTTPDVNPVTNAITFTLASPHCKVGAVVVAGACSPSSALNTGFFRILIPNGVITDIWHLDPATLTTASLNVSVGGAGITPTLTSVAATATSPAGVLIASAPGGITYSTPQVSVAPAPAPPGGGGSPASEPKEPREPEPQVRVPEMAGGAAGPVTSVDRMVIGASGKVGVPAALRGDGAQLQIPAGTSVTTAAGLPYSGSLIPPYRIPVPTDRLVSVYEFPHIGVGEIRFSLPVTLTLPAPANTDPRALQPVSVDASGALTYLAGRLSEGGIAFDTDHLSRYGLTRIARPLPSVVSRTTVAAAGYHALWAGQSDIGGLAPGQIIDVAVRYLNTGDRAWIRGELGAQANLGSNEPAGNARDVDAGIVVSPLWGRDRFATAEEALVAPGAVGTFWIRLRAPSTPGTYRVAVRPVVDGVTWMEDEGAYLEIRVR